MAEHDDARAITNAILGGDVDVSLKGWLHQEIKEISPEITEYRCQLDDLATQDDEPEQMPEPIVDTAEAELSASADYAASQIQAALHHTFQAKRYQAAMTLRHNIDRPVHHPEVGLNFAFLAGLTTIEGLITALFFLSGGFVAGVGEALGLGLTISGVNVLVAALIGGGFFGRYWNYGLAARQADASMRTKRYFGRFGSLVTGACLAGLLVTSGIVRATGETEHLSFTLEALTTAATDFHSLMLWVIGTAFAILAWRKGLNAFSDPYPGLSHASKAVSQAAADLKQASEEALRRINEVYEDGAAAIDALCHALAEAMEERGQAILKANHLREELFGQITEIESGFSAQAAYERSLNEIVSGRSKPAPKAEFDELGTTLDLTYLRERLPAVTASKPAAPEAFSKARVAALSRLSSARKTALDEVLSAQKYEPD